MNLTSKRSGAPDFEPVAQRVQRVFERPRVESRADALVDALAEVADHRREIAGGRVRRAAVELLADLAQQRLERPHVGRGGRNELGAEVAHHRFDRRGVDFDRPVAERAQRLFERRDVERRSGALVEPRAEVAHHAGQRLERSADGGGAVELLRDVAQHRFELGRVGLALDHAVQAVDAAGEIFEDARVDRRGLRRTPQRRVHALGKVFEPALDRGERGGGGRAFDLRARVGDQRAEPRRFGLRRRAGGETVDPVGEFADLLFEPLDRHRPRRGGGEQVAHFFGLGADALESGGIDDALGDRVDLGAERAQLALEPGDGGVGIMGAQGLARFDDQRGQRVARAAVAERGDAIAQIAHRALERDDRVARREIDEAARHRRQLAAQGLHVGRGRRRLLGLLAAHLFEPRGERGDLFAQRLDAGRRGGFGAGGARAGRGSPADARASSSLRRRAICAAASFGSKRGRSAG